MKKESVKYFLRGRKRKKSVVEEAITEDNLRGNSLHDIKSALWKVRNTKKHPAVPFYLPLGFTKEKKVDMIIWRKKN